MKEMISTVMKEMISYYQIDFLRLFRLCVNEGIVNKKRKMPVDYINDMNKFTQNISNENRG